MGGLVTRESGFPLGDKASLSLASVIALNILPLSSIVIAVLVSLKGYTFSERPRMSQPPCHRGMANGATGGTSQMADLKKHSFIPKPLNRTL